MNIFNLFAKLILDDSEYKKKIAEAKGENKKLIKEEQRAKEKSVARWLAVGTAITAVAAVMKNLIYNTTEYAGSIKDLAQVYETTYQNIQELNYIAQESGKNAEWVLRKARSSGESYAEILGLTNEEYAEMVANAHEMGLVMENEIIDRADELGDRISALKYQWQAVLVSLLAGEEDAEEKLEMFFDRMLQVAERFMPAVVQFAVKLLAQVAVALVKYLPQLINDLTTEVMNSLTETLPQLIWNLVKALVQTVINNVINMLVGWLRIFGVDVPQVDLMGGAESGTSIAPSSQGYEITEKVEQDITIKIESDGVTANDKVVASSLEDLIDEKLGRMLGGI